VRIIPIVISIYGYTYGSVLGVFLAGMLTKSRGNDFGNIFAMIIGFIIVAILSGLPNKIAGIFGGKLYTQPSWLPVMEFPWWICFGTIMTFSSPFCSEPAASITRRASPKSNTKARIDWSRVANYLTCNAGLFTHPQPPKFYAPCSDGQM